MTAMVQLTQESVAFLALTTIAHVYFACRNQALRRHYIAFYTDCT